MQTDEEESYRDVRNKNSGSHHIKKTGQPVMVIRNNSTVIVKDMKGATLEAFEPTDMPKFYSKYASNVARRG